MSKFIIDAVVQKSNTTPVIYNVFETRPSKTLWKVMIFMSIPILVPRPMPVHDPRASSRLSDPSGDSQSPYWCVSGLLLKSPRASQHV